MKQDAINQTVMDGILHRVQHLVRPDRVRELLERTINRYLDTEPDRLAKIERELTRVTKEINRMIIAHTKFEMDLPEDKVNELKSRQKTLEAQRDGLIASGYQKIASNIETEVDQFLEKLAAAQTVLEIGNAQDRIRLREAFLAKAEVFCYNKRLEVRLSWRRIPKLAEGSDTGHLHIIAANLEDDDLEVERYLYDNAKLIPITVGEV